MDLNAAALVQDNVTALVCRFHNGKKDYTYLVADDNGTDDCAVVMVGDKLEVVSIVRRTEVPVGVSYQLKYVIQTFTMERYCDTLANHQEIVERIASAVRTKARAAFKHEMQQMLAGD